MHTRYIHVLAAFYTSELVGNVARMQKFQAFEYALPFSTSLSSGMTVTAVTIRHTPEWNYLLKVVNITQSSGSNMGLYNYIIPYP